MQYLYIDESGSMTIDHFNDWPYFVIAIVRCGNPDKWSRQDLCAKLFAGSG